MGPRRVTVGELWVCAQGTLTFIVHRCHSSVVLLGRVYRLVHGGHGSVLSFWVSTMDTPQKWAPCRLAHSSLGSL